MIRPEVISQHAEEAADLWSRRDGLVRDPEITLKELGRLDERIEAHLDGLRIAGYEAREVCDEILPGASGGEVFARFLWAFSAGAGDQIDAVISASEESLDASRGLSSALGWLRYQEAESHIRRLLTAESPRLKRAGIAASAAHRRHPGAALRDGILSPDPDLRLRSLRAVGEIGAQGEVPYVLERCEAGNPAEQFWSAWSAAVLCRRSRPLEVLMSVVEGGAARADLALAVLFRRMNPQQADHWIGTLLRCGKHSKLGILALGMQGDPAKVPLLFDLMESVALARICGAAFRMITGQDLKRQYLDRPAPDVANGKSVSEEENHDELLDADLDLPWPDVIKIKARWFELSGQFAPGRHYLLGKAIATDSMQDVLLIGRQRERISAAIALSVREPGRPLFKCYSRAPRQYRELRGTG
jgi:uncharacterized protein (TIGR02270 family)